MIIDFAAAAAAAAAADAASCNNVFARRQYAFLCDVFVQDPARFMNVYILSNYSHHCYRAQCILRILKPGNNNKIPCNLTKAASNYGVAIRLYIFATLVE